MRVVLVVAVILGIMSVIISATPVIDPVEHEELQIDDQIDLHVKDGDNEVEVPSRTKRATCDLLSIFNVNDSACAAHCLAKRFRGGYCNKKKVCVCRR